MAPTGFTIDDFNEINGLVTISKSLGTFNVVAKNDLTTEGDQSFAVELWTDSNRTQSLAKSKFITIADTSVNPPTFNYGIRAYDTNKYTYEFPQTIDNSNKIIHFEFFSLINRCKKIRLPNLTALKVCVFLL
jgi:hypothetical protein